MKKILVMLLVLLSGIFSNAFAIENIVSLDEIEQEKPKQETIIEKTLEAKVTFDWLDLNETQRQEKIDYYRDLLFANNKSRIYFTKDEFKKEFANYYKDKDFKYHYMVTNNGVTEDENAKYCAFYFKKGTLIMYAIQYKNLLGKAFYYSAFGKLYYTDLMSDEYPNFPYTSMQYDRKGQLKSAIYFVGKDLQYMYSPEQEFQGIWYKDKMYDKSGKQVLTRNNW